MMALYFTVAALGALMFAGNKISKAKLVGGSAHTGTFCGGGTGEGDERAACSNVPVINCDHGSK